MNSETARPGAGGMPSLDDDDVHVWQVDLNNGTADTHFHVLSNDEQMKAERLATRQLQMHYRRCRAALRVLLSRYTGRAAANLMLEYNRFGKPMLAGQWHFNVSHSGAHALIAIARRPLGIDLENCDKPGIDVDEIMDLVCHPLEKTAIAGLPELERRIAFFGLWTRKEAYCKALGDGLSHSLTAVRMHHLPGTTISMVIDGLAEGDARYFVHALKVLKGYEASLCVSSAKLHIQTYPFEEFS
jgi:4'-phosphopantetheinyl transferase